MHHSFAQACKLAFSNVKPKSFCNCSRTFWAYIAPFAFLSERTVVAGRSGCLGGCTILPYCRRTFWVYIAPFAFLSKRLVCSLALLIAVFLTSGEGTCASNPSKRFKESVKKTCCVECWLFLLWWAWQP